MPPPTVQQLAELTFKQFKALPKTGKPTANEWTVLSAVLLHNAATDVTTVVALGCGTKCIGQSKLCGQGFVLNDTHAEVLARRAFLRYIYRELRKACEPTAPTESIYSWSEADVEFQLAPGISFHFVSTQTPCGDACIGNTDAVIGATEDCAEITAKRRKLDGIGVSDGAAEAASVGCLLSDTGDTIFTGAKLIGQEHKDAMQQTLGAVRTKPGRGDRTLSMSCSDKLARWNVLGVQGALLDTLLQEPIYFQTLNFCCATKRECIERAIYQRWAGRKFEHFRFKAQVPAIRIHTDATFESGQQSGRVQPSPNGLSWSHVDSNFKPYEISVNGKRQGVTNKKLHTPQAALKISKFHLLQEYVDLLRVKSQLVDKFSLSSKCLERIEYLDYKQLALNYQSAWSMLRTAYFQQWTQKPQKLLKFCLARQSSADYHQPNVLAASAPYCS